MSSMIILSFMMILMMKHPLSMGITLLMTAMISSILSLMMMNSPWYPFIFFIIMVGGVLVLFLYMASISPNSMKPSSIIMPMMITITISIFMNQNMKINQTTDNLLTMKTLFMSTNSWMIPLMAMYLLITMILIIKITNKNKSPLRKM
uniref:NADH dehydrogenase subunit 6 n=1 Tax=Symphylella sp. YG-2006 TaxID=390856 RepID=B7S774_9MYRI|nr:NADH dehydrogenase subunit 6 [Symphylella sp. YG-2006]ABQ01743.1 NADH dehydrogenase subunit 6 [Symphylella sp. YG-2006]